MTTRRILQAGFLVLTLVGVFVVKGNAERWCPFGGVEAVYTYATDGNMLCSLGVSNFYILAGVLAATLLLRRVFCGYMCPIGTISEWLGRAAARLKIPQVRLPDRLDRRLMLLKYPVLILILFITYRASELLFRAFDPCYALLSRHGEDITFWAYVVAGGIVLGSLLITVPFCRWLCPLAAVLNVFSRFGLTRIKRNEDACVACGHCATACPMNIPVDDVKEVTHARCLSCMNCVDACPATEKGALLWGPPAAIGRRWPQAVLVVVMLACVGAAVAATFLVPLPSYVFARDEVPAETAVVDLRVRGITCRGSANLFSFFVDRDDDFAIPGYVRVEAWPGPGFVPVRIAYDPARADAEAVRRAITEPYYNAAENLWRTPHFEIEGYDPLNLDGLDADTPAESQPAP
jgi:ferredoxin